MAREAEQSCCRAGASLVDAFGWPALSGMLESVGNPAVAPVVSFVVAAIFAGLIYWLSNMPSIADFLIVAEGEIK